MPSKTKSALAPSARIKSKPLLTRNAPAKTIALSQSTISRAPRSTTRTISQIQKVTLSATSLPLNSSSNTPASNLLWTKKRSLMRLANKPLSSCLSPLSSFWFSIISNRLSNLTKRSMMSTLSPPLTSLLSSTLPMICGNTF